MTTLTASLIFSRIAKNVEIFSRYIGVDLVLETECSLSKS